MSDAGGVAIPGTMLLDRSVVENPYPFYERLRQEAPVWRVPGTNVFAVTSFEAVAEIVARTDDFSNVVRNLLYRGDDGLPRQLELGDLNVEALASSDPPVHTVHRKAVFPELVARKMAALEGEVHDLARSRIGKFVAGGGDDFMDEVANAIPIRVIGRLIGFRDAEPEMLLQAAFDSTRMVGGTSTLDEITEIIARTVDVAVWVADQLTIDGADGDSLIAAAQRGIAAGDLGEDQGAIILHTLLSAGGESTTSLIGNAARILAERPDIQARLRADYAAVPAFIEEVLRLESPFRQQMRSIPADTQLLGIDVPAGSTMLVFFSAANRDPAEYEQADELRLDRETVKHHLAFGRGIHFCVGAPLARLEARVVLTELLEATSTIALDPAAPPTRLYSLLARRHETLPLVVTGR